MAPERHVWRQMPNLSFMAFLYHKYFVKMPNLARNAKFGINILLNIELLGLHST